MTDEDIATLIERWAQYIDPTTGGSTEDAFDLADKAKDMLDEIERLQRTVDEQRTVTAQMAAELECATNWLAFLDAKTGAWRPYEYFADVLPWIAAQPEAQLIDGVPNGGGAS